MNCHGVRVLINAAFIACLFGGATKAQSPGEADAYIANAPIAGVPKGAYSEWTQGEKKTAYTRIGGFCEFLCVDSYGNTSFRNAAAAERAKAEAKVCLEACIVNHLPSDYPRLADLKQQLKLDFGHAQQLGSPIPWPLPGKR